MFSSRITKAGGLVTGGGDVFRDEHSLSFGGDNDYLSCESNFESILFNAPFSMVFWLKADDGRPSAIEYLVGTKSGEDNIWARIETDGDIQGSVSMTSYFDGIAWQMSTKNNIGLVVKAAEDSTSLYIAGVIRTASLTYTASGIQLKIGIVKD